MTVERQREVLREARELGEKLAVKPEVPAILRQEKKMKIKIISAEAGWNPLAIRGIDAGQGIIIKFRINDEAYTKELFVKNFLDRLPSEDQILEALKVEVAHLQKEKEKQEYIKSLSNKEFDI